MKSEKVLVIADGASFGPQMNDIYRLMQEDNAKFSLYLPESLEWLLLKADLLGQPDILEILQHLHDLHLLGCKYYRGRLTSLCLCKNSESVI